MLKRHEVQVLRRAGHTWKEIAALSGVSVRTVRRIAAEADITTIDNTAERARRQAGRPSKADDYRDVFVQALTEEPLLRSVELSQHDFVEVRVRYQDGTEEIVHFFASRLHRARQAGYTGGKSAIRSPRPFGSTS